MFLIMVSKTLHYRVVLYVISGIIGIIKMVLKKKIKGILNSKLFIIITNIKGI